MAVNLHEAADLRAVPGVRIASAPAGIKQNLRDDLALFEFCPGTQIAGVYTQSHFAAAPVQLARQRQSTSRSWVVNSGNANAATGAPGLEDAHAVCRQVARLLDISEVQVQPFSTGVIGERLPVAQINGALEKAAAGLNEDGWLSAARAIMTTDTVVKGYSLQCELDGETITLTGIAKGSGMIKPDMATMLAYVACDAHVTYEAAQHLVSDAAMQSFNRITVDGDTSTNDCFMFAATGCADHQVINGREHPNYFVLLRALIELSRLLAQAIVRDGEGATKFVTICVRGGRSSDDCLSVAYTIAESPLVKTALFAGDANWGRFCMAIGRAPVPGLNPDKVQLFLDDVQVAEGGLMASDYTDARGSAVLAQDEFVITIDLGLGVSSETLWTTDLSYEYVRINAEYRS